MNTKDKKKIISSCLENCPLRLAVTDYCNLRCFFCSNEGMPSSQKNTRQIDVEDAFFIIECLADAGLKKLSITGGEPAIYADILEIIKKIGDLHFSECFFHTNGSELTSELIDLINRGFTKLAISLHSSSFDTWNKLTGGSRHNYDKILSNLDYISQMTDRRFVLELKYVPVRNVNDDPEEIRQFLMLAAKHGAKVKFLNFEPIKKEHLPLALSPEECFSRLIEAGCVFQKNEKSFRGQKSYLPLKHFSFGDTKGVAIEIGCGEKEACQNCHLANEVFISPKLEIKPCHAHSRTISIADAVRRRDPEAIKEKVLESRIFLSTMPGLGAQTWKSK